MDYNRQWLEEVGSEDSHGRALWALGTVLARSKRAGLQGMAVRLFEEALPAVTGRLPARVPGRFPCWASSIISGASRETGLC